MHPRHSWALFLLLCAQCCLCVSLSAVEAPAFGVQAGLTVPLQSDLRVTTGDGANPTLGFHADWALRGGAVLRTRLDVGLFSSADRSSATPAFQQTLHTRVRAGVMGAEYLLRPSDEVPVFTVGAGLYLIQWNVNSTNTMITPTGSFAPESSSTWTREGLGVLALYRWNRHAETELKVIFSHYGYENLATRMVTLNVLWNF